MELTVGYFQIDKKTKKLITSEISFSGFISPTDFSGGVYNYSLSLKFYPLSHTELAIAFALPWYVYIIMYIIVGLIGIVMVGIYTVYHRVLTKNRQIAFSMLSLWTAYIPSNVFGFIYAILPQAIYILLISTFFTQQFMYFLLKKDF